MRRQLVHGVNFNRTVVEAHVPQLQMSDGSSEMDVFYPEYVSQSNALLGCFPLPVGIMDVSCGIRHSLSAQR